MISGKTPNRPGRGEPPLPQRGIPDPPAWLDTEGQRCWAETVPELDRLGLLTVIDGCALAGYCVAWSQLVAANALLAKEGMTCTGGSGGLKPHPGISIRNQALTHLRAFAALFGLDPSSRQRLESEPPGGAEEDAMDAFLRETGKTP